MVATVAAAPASVVVTAITAMPAFVPETVEPGLKPYQPNHRMNTPSAASGRLWPLMGFMLFPTYFPILGPRMMAPARADHPPTLCTTVEPAKSMSGMPSDASQPPPQIQWPTIG